MSWRVVSLPTDDRFDITVLWFYNERKEFSSVCYKVFAALKVSVITPQVSLFKSLVIVFNVSKMQAHRQSLSLTVNFVKA